MIYAISPSDAYLDELFADRSRGHCHAIGPDRKHVKTLAQPSAILDLHFQPTKSRRDVLAVASSTASLSIFRLNLAGHSDQTPDLEPVSVVRIEGVEDDVLFLSCAWHPIVPDTIAVTTSKGAVYVMTMDMNQRFAVFPQAAVLTHTLETWTAAFSPYTSQLPSRVDALSEYRDEQGTDSTRSLATLYSGGDDSLMQYTSCVLPTCSSFPPNASRPTDFASRKIRGHDAGVTAILPVLLTDADGGEIVVTGSYDDHIRVFSIRNSSATGGNRQATCLATQDLGGGVWRLKLISQSTSTDVRHWNLRLLASCMHAGVRIVDIEGDILGTCRITVVARFEDHKSMNYGSDFFPNNPLLYMSTSFYDKLLCIWEMKPWAAEASNQQGTISD